MTLLAVCFLQHHERPVRAPAYIAGHVRWGGAGEHWVQPTLWVGSISANISASLQAHMGDSGVQWQMSTGGLGIETNCTAVHIADSSIRKYCTPVINARLVSSNFRSRLRILVRWSLFSVFCVPFAIASLSLAMHFFVSLRLSFTTVLGIFDASCRSDFYLPSPFWSRNETVVAVWPVHLLLAMSNVAVGSCHANGVLWHCPSELHC